MATKRRTTKADYQEYVRQFKSLQAKAKKKGFQMQDAQIYSRLEFDAMFEGRMNDLIEAQKTAKKKINLDTYNMAEDLAQRQAYAFYPEQGRKVQVAFNKIAAEQGEERRFTLSELLEDRVPQDELKKYWKVVDDVYWEYRDSGYNADQARAMVGIIYFDSK